MVRVLLLEHIHPGADALFTGAGYEVRSLPRSLDEAELIDALEGVNVLGIRSKTHVTDRVLDAARDLTAIGAFCIGTNQIDLAGASERGIAVFNSPFSNTRRVVELAGIERRKGDNDAALAELANWKGLKYLDVQEAPVTDKGLELLRKAKPALKILSGGVPPPPPAPYSR